MSNQGPLPIQAVEPDAGNPPVPSRYVMIHIEKFNARESQTRNDHFTRSDHTDYRRCTIPIEKRQVRLCIPNATFLSEMTKLEDLVEAKKYIHLANDILKRDIHNLGGWDLVGYSIKRSPKSQPKTDPQRSEARRAFGHMMRDYEEDLEYEDDGDYGIDQWGQPMMNSLRRSSNEPGEDGELVMVVRIWGRKLEDRLLE